MPVDEKIAPESSPEAPAPVAEENQQENAQGEGEKALTERQVREYLKKGKLPSEKPEETESAPSEEESQPQAESAPADKPEKAKGEKADARKAQLTNEIKDLVGKKNGAGAELAEIQRQIAEAKQQLADVSKPKETAQPDKPATLKRPKLADFDTYEAYEVALDKYDAQVEERSAKVAEERVREALKQRDEAQTKAEQDRLAKERLKRWDQGVSDLGVDDFAEVVLGNPNLPVTDLMRDAILELENGPKVAYHLGKNPDEAARIAALPAIRVVAELAKLEARLEALEPPKPSSGTERPKVTKAAPPARELSTSQVAVDPLTALEERAAKGDTEAVREWQRIRNEQERAKHRR